MADIRNFRDDFIYGELSGREEIWRKIFQEKFPTMIRYNKVDNITAQRAGIDIEVFLVGGKSIRVQRKVRRKDYRIDTLLEYKHAGPKYNATGWINEDLGISWIVFYYEPTGRVQWLDWPLLKRAWAEHGDEWLGKYKIKESQNPGYITYNVAVPNSVLKGAMYPKTNEAVQAKFF